MLPLPGAGLDSTFLEFMFLVYFLDFTEMEQGNRLDP